VNEYALTLAARLDLFDIWEFITRDNIEAADRVLEEINFGMQLLADNPDLAHLRRDLASEPVKFWLVHSYFVIYRPGTTPLEVLRVLSRYRDVKELLK
jgi:antitoxin ParD1/3/4